MGVNPQAVSSSISNTMRGVEVGRFNNAEGRELRVFAQLGDADRAGLDDVRSMTFRTASCLPSISTELAPIGGAGIGTVGRSSASWPESAAS